MLIGEVSRRSGVSVRMLRHYDSLGLLRPSGHTTGGHREYSDADLRRLLHVESLRSLGLSLRQAGDALDRPDFDPQALVGTLIEHTEARIDAQQALLHRLRHVAATEAREWDEVLAAVDLLRGLSSPDPAVRQQAVLTDPAAADAAPEALTRAALREPVPNVAGALRWALDHGAGPDPEALSDALARGDAEQRRRCVDILSDAAPSAFRTALLRTALEDTDPVVHATAALLVGAEGGDAAVHTLLQMVVDGRRDVDAGDTLAGLSGDPVVAQQVVEGITRELSVSDRGPSARIRLLQVLVDLPHPAATDALRATADEPDPEVARVAAAFLAVRLRRPGPDRHQPPGAPIGRAGCA